jgi:peptidyl-prolyl cis-trans isomerase C
VRRLLGEPLVQFLLVGLALFGAWHLVRPATAGPDASNRIVITEGDVRQMEADWASQGMPPPTPEQLRSLLEAKVREEVLYREALALGLDKGDAIVRRQLARKMEFVTEDLSKLQEPKPEQLHAWFEKHQDRFALPARATFRHLYFSPDRRGTNTRADAEAALARLAGKPMDEQVVTGDPFMFQGYYGDRSLEVVAKEFGPAFAKSLAALQPGAWSGPVESGYGWHLVFIDSMTPPRVPDFDEIQPEVRTAWIEEQREQTRNKLYQSMRARYEVVLPPS